MTGYRLAAAWRSLPLGSNQSGYFLPWIVALLVYVAGLSGVGLIVLDASLRASEQAAAATLTLRVPADTSDARLQTVLALLRQTRGIVSVHLLEPAETARLLEPWLGSTVPLDQLPVPRLIDLRIDPDEGMDAAALQQQIASVVPDVLLDDHRPGPEGMRAAVRRIEDILAAGIAVALLLIAVSTLFAVRTVLMVDRSVVELLHVLGAADAAIAREFAARALGLGLLGGAIGAIAALCTILALGGAGSIVQLPAPLAGNVIAVSGVGDWRVWGILSGSVPVAGLIATASAWVAVRRRLAGMP
jgi:cell division transport system permease protein